MRSGIRPVALLITLIAALAVASPAMAKGGTCATFSSYGASTAPFDATRAQLVVDYAVAYTCIDESWPPISFTIKDERTGFTSRSVFFGPILPGLHEQVFGAAYNARYTITTTLTQASNGKVYDTRTNTVTTPAAP